MGFTETRRATIEALRDGRFEHEERDQAEGKNLLATGEVSVDDVIGLLERCKGTQHESRPHHLDPEQQIDVFRPKLGTVRWYIKTYLADWDGIVAVIISVHRS
jgi:hypothetical protein